MKKCLLVIDVQRDFVDGALGFEKALTIQDRIADKIRAYKASNDQVIFTQDTHQENYLDTEEGNHLPVEHCIKGTEGHEIIPELKALIDDKDIIIEKDTFPSLDLGILLKEAAYDEIELVGLVSNICVISNAIIAKAACPQAKIIVDTAATASFDETLHEKALDIMEGLHIHLKNRG